MSLRGSCLCGAVEFEVAGELERQPEACHCSMCRKQSGHYLAAVNVRRTSLMMDEARTGLTRARASMLLKGFLTKSTSPSEA